MPRMIHASLAGILDVISSFATFWSRAARAFWLAVTLSMFATASLSSAATLDCTVARINQDIITETDIAETLAEESGTLQPATSKAFESATTETVATLLDRTLLIQEAKKLKIEPTDDEIQAQVESMVDDIRAHFSSEKDFRESLASDRMSIDELKSELTKRAKADFRVFHAVSSRFSISREEVQAFEKECQAKGQQFTSYRLKRLGIPITKYQDAEAASAKAREIVARIITEGISFDEGVRKYGQVPGCQEDGGDMGNLSSDKLSPAIRAAVEKIDPGQATAPIIAGGFANVFYLDNRRGPRSLLTEKRFGQAKDSLLKDLRRKATLQVYDDRFKQLLPEEYRAVLNRTDQSSLSPATLSPSAGNSENTRQIPDGRSYGQVYPAAPVARREPQIPPQPQAPPQRHPFFGLFRGRQ